MQNTNVISQTESRSIKVSKATSAYLKRRANKLHRKSLTARSNGTRNRLTNNAERTRKYANELYFMWS
ncbi:hypothetical protein [Photobacterium damselae]|uniref:Uncharacterized protein n=1 Tax=Photobacterium damselae subsp. damselae TaxID=85581 RepID=A0AAD3WUQ6_PHODD|nr:hypothetical protein [Photobacterium damselae]KAB1179913.1 hypothetical protein F6450_12070 [Photobacterium damselae subsp. damselae]MCG3823450.1 hypothetical protein [Photobacterium damselae]PSB83337.1 hypothetical protein C5F64_14800 [Photobacterium damselae subsp. damselae]